MEWEEGGSTNVPGRFVVFDSAAQQVGVCCGFVVVVVSFGGVCAYHLVFVVLIC